MHCPHCGLRVCKDGLRCRYGDGCRFCHCELDNLETLALLEQRLEKGEASEDWKEIRFALLDLMEWTEAYAAKEHERLLGYAEKLLHLNKAREDHFGTSNTLRKIYFIKRNSGHYDAQSLKIALETLLDFDADREDWVGQGKTLTLLMRWAEDHAADDPKEMQRILSQQLDVQRQSHNLPGVGMTLTRLLNHARRYESENADLQRSLILQQIEVQKEDGNLQGLGIALQAHIAWLESFEPENETMMWSLLEEKLATDRLAEDHESEAMTLQRMVNICDHRTDLDAQQHRALLVQMREVDQRLEEPVSTSMTLQRLINWTEAHEPDNHDVLWELLCAHLEANRRAGSELSQAMTLRRMLNGHAQTPNEDRWKQILAWIERLEGPDPEAWFSTNAIRTSVGMDPLPFPKGYDAQATTQHSMMHAIFSPKQGNTPFRMLVQSRSEDWVREAIDARKDSFPSTMVVDFPNLLHLSQHREAGLEEVVAFLNASDAERTVLHLTLSVILDLWAEVEAVIQRCPQVEWSYAQLWYSVPEDANILALAVEFDADVVSNDRFRDEQKAYPELVEMGVFERVQRWPA